MISPTQTWRISMYSKNRLRLPKGVEDKPCAHEENAHEEGARERSVTPLAAKAAPTRKPNHPKADMISPNTTIATTKKTRNPTVDNYSIHTKIGLRSTRLFLSRCWTLL